MELVGVLNEVEKAITNKENGILTEINNLMSATDDKQKQAAVFTLIGTVISLVIGIIRAAVGPAGQAAGGSSGQITGGPTGQTSGSNIPKNSWVDLIEKVSSLSHSS